MLIKLHCGDCLDILPTIESESVDAIITDPPYPEISRSYGRWTTEQWWELMVEGVIPQVRRILKPTGSAVFILQPNSKHVGQMRGWLWEFMAWVCREWNMVQDVWWWNFIAQPTKHANRDIGLMRPSVKACVWCGMPFCFRWQRQVLWTESQANKAFRQSERVRYTPRGGIMNEGRCSQAALERGGVTPFNLLPLGTESHNSAGAHGHAAGTPLKLADWWTRYIVPPGGTVLDPFVGSGTMMLAAIQNGCNGIGIDKERRYIDIAQRRVDEAMEKMVQAKMRF